MPKIPIQPVRPQPTRPVQQPTRPGGNEIARPNPVTPRPAPSRPEDRRVPSSDARGRGLTHNTNFRRAYYKAKKKKLKSFSFGGKNYKV